MVRSRPNGNRRNAARRSLVRPSTIARRVENIDIGVEFKPTLDQPRWTSAPWWPITVVSDIAAPTSYSFKVLHALVLTSLNLDKFKEGTKTIVFNVRVQTVRVWGLNRQPITLEIFSNSPVGCKKMKQLNDRGSPIHYSHLAWRFGRSSFAYLETGCDTDDTTVFSVSGALDASNKASVYVQLLVQRQGIAGAKAIQIAPQSFESQLTSGFEVLMRE